MNLLDKMRCRCLCSGINYSLTSISRKVWPVLQASDLTALTHHISPAPHHTPGPAVSGKSLKNIHNLMRSHVIAQTLLVMSKHLKYLHVDQNDRQLLHDSPALLRVIQSVNILTVKMSNHITNGE